MTNGMRRCAAMAIVAGMAAWGAAAEAEVGADVASAYVFRGVTYNDGAVFQPYLSVSELPIEWLPLEFGVWANLDIGDNDGTLKEGEFSEVDLLVTYPLPLGITNLNTSVTYQQYMYPESEAESDQEIQMEVGLDTLLSPTLGLAYGVDGGIQSSLHAEFGIEHEVALPLEAALTLGASVAYENPDKGEDGFSYATASAKLSYSVLYAGVACIGQLDDDVLPDADDTEEGVGHDVDVVATVGAAVTF